MRIRTALAAILLLAATTAGLAREARTAGIEVRGKLIDIRTAGGKETVFPQNNDYKFDEVLNSQITAGTRYACSLVEFRGPEQFRLAKKGSCLIALDTDHVGDPGWKPTGEVLEMGHGLVYHVFERRKCEAGEWIDVPYPEGCCHTAIVIGDGIGVADTPEYGTVICKVSELRRKNAYNQTMTMLPDGSLLACCSMGMPRGPEMFISRDKGETWQPHGSFDARRNKVGNYFNLFVHRGSVYLMGIDRERTGLFISRSDDGGLTWSVPADSHTGVLMKGDYHTAPVPMCYDGGRIWRACETKNGTKYGHPFVMSAPEDADLLDAASWTCTNTVTNDIREAMGYTLTGSIIEGNAVNLREGGVVNLIRTNSTSTSKIATILHVHGADSLSFDSGDGIVVMPGGGKKFTCRYDPVSDLYWALTNPDAEEKVTHDGIYRKGMSHSLMRNRLALICSRDLHEWRVVDDSVLYDPDYFFHGFQYADWVFDGDDIAAVVRVAAPESRGLPQRQHDSNMMTFVRIRNFRNAAR